MGDRGIGREGESDGTTQRWPCLPLSLSPTLPIASLGVTALNDLASRLTAAGRFQALPQGRRQTPDDELDGFLRRVRDAAESQLVLVEDAMLHHEPTPGAQAFPELRAH